MGYLPLEKLHQLYDGYRRLFRLNGQEYLLLQEDGRCSLLLNQCPHQQAPLHKATVEDNHIRCARHGIRFNLRTGQPDGGASCGALVFLPLIYEGNSIGVDSALLSHQSLHFQKD